MLKSTKAKAGTALIILTGLALLMPRHDPLMIPRNPQWGKVRAAWLKNHNSCEACGVKVDLEVHHIKPFHTNPELELDPTNFITLCRNHHLTLGHDPDGPKGPKSRNWSKSNPNVKQDAQDYRRANTHN